LSTVEFSVAIEYLGKTPPRCETRFSMQSARPWSTLHALVRRSGEPCSWTRARRSSQLRLHPDHRSHLDVLASDSSFCSRDLYAGVAAASQRNSEPSTHMRCRITASLRATAITARLWPRVLASRTPHALSADHCAVRVSRSARLRTASSERRRRQLWRCAPGCRARRIGSASGSARSGLPRCART